MPKTQNRASPGDGIDNKQIAVTCRTADSLPLDKIIAFQGELKSLSKVEFEKLKKSIVKFGLSFPSFIWKKNGDAKCLDGHQRSRVLTEMKKEGWKIPEVPVVYVDAKNEKEAKEKILLLSSQYGKYTMDSVYEFMTGADIDFGDMKDIIDLPQFDLDKFERGYFTDPIEEGPEPRFDEAEALRKKYGVELGQVWELGEHRLMCGDATRAEDVAMLLNGTFPFLCVTDPPYGVDYDPAWRNKAAAEGLLAYADRRIGPVQNDDRSNWKAAWELFPGDVIYSWHPPGATSLIHAAALQDSGFVIRMQIIWAKSNFPIGRSDYHVRHEPCWYAVRDGKPSHRTNDRTQTTLWEINLDKNVEGGHSTQKPLECMARPIRNHGGKGDAIYDPFVGSGTTIVACEQLSRRCYAMDIFPPYVAVSLQRWADLTGKTPKLATGKSGPIK